MSIPNPNKKLTIPFRLEQVKTAVVKIPVLLAKYPLLTKNDVLNQYTYSASEFLSIGVLIDLQVSEVDDKRSEIFIEVKRKYGAFDKEYEVTYAHQHIDNILNGLTNLLANPDQILQPATAPAPSGGMGCLVIALIPAGITLLYLLA